jgi:hypothetical protein
MLSPGGEVATNRVLLRDALDFAVAHPLRELALVPARLYHLFRGDHVWQSWYQPGTPRVLPTEAARRTLGRVGDAYCAAVGVLALVGWRRRPRAGAAAWRVVGLLMLAWIAVFALVYGDPRFHQALVPPACVLAAVALTGPREGRDPERMDAASAR